MVTLIIRFGFCAACLTNPFLIYMTIFHTTYIKGTFKYMIIIFATSCVVFDAVEILSRPSLHNFNASVIYFSESGHLDIYLDLILFYAGLYTSLIAFVGVQFVFRYSTIINFQSLLKTFQGFRRLYWLPVIIIPGVMFAGFGAILLQPDEYSDDYVRGEVRKVYLEHVEDVPRLVMVLYDANGNIRWKNLCYCISAISIMTYLYAIIIFCAVNMHLNISVKLANASYRYRSLERQFFKALLVQITLPTFFLTLPILPVILIPLLDIKISFHSSVFYSVLALYPSLDSMAMMMIVSEYRKCLKKLLCCRLMSRKEDSSSFGMPAVIALNAI